MPPPPPGTTVCDRPAVEPQEGEGRREMNANFFHQNPTPVPPPPHLLPRSCCRRRDFYVTLSPRWRRPSRICETMRWRRQVVPASRVCARARMTVIIPVQRINDNNIFILIIRIAATGYCEQGRCALINCKL